MTITLLIVQLLIVLALIFIGARVGGIGLGIYGMLGVFRPKGDCPWRTDAAA
ncbi:MAG: hypothetical protein SPH30_03575 [Prevotella sp.]|nr:hypothetical protein [Prevotella sp.]